MAFTYDPSTDRGGTRQFLADTTEPGQFTDAEVDAWLSTAADRSLSGERARHYAAHLGWLARAGRMALSATSHSDEGRSVSYDATACERMATMHLEQSGEADKVAAAAVTAVFTALPMDQGWTEVS